MKTKDIFTLIGLGIMAWFFLKPKVARAEEISEIPEVPKPEVYTVPPKEIIPTYSFPKPGAYIAELIPFKEAIPPKVPAEEVEKPLSLAEIMEAVVERAKYG